MRCGVLNSMERMTDCGPSRWFTATQRYVWSRSKTGSAWSTLKTTWMTRSGPPRSGQRLLDPRDAANLLSEEVDQHSRARAIRSAAAVEADPVARAGRGAGGSGGWFGIVRSASGAGRHQGQQDRSASARRNEALDGGDYPSFQALFRGPPCARWRGLCRGRGAEGRVRRLPGRGRHQPALQVQDPGAFQRWIF